MVELENKILEYINKMNKKLNYDDLRKKMGISGHDELTSFNLALLSLEEKGYLSKNKYGEYLVNMNPNIGILSIDKYSQGHVKTNMNRYTISNENLNGALNGDSILIDDLTKSVIKITKRNRSHTFVYLGNNLFESYGERNKIYVLLDDRSCKNLIEGYLVTINVSNEKEDNYYTGTITSICGHKDDPTSDIYAIVFNHGFCNNFSTGIQKEISNIPDEVRECDKLNRVDLTNENIFTIDGIDTKDMDDAISISKNNENYILKVHIADVPYYVKDAPATFKEALDRGTSGYFADFVIPMFPHKLSNGICSLNENVDRLTKTVEMEIDPEGNIIKSSIYNSVIHSKKKMNYNAVNQILENNIIPQGYEPFKDDLLLMNELSKILDKKRKNKGFLEFNDEEVKVKTDESGNPEEIKILKQKSAEKLIENFMIAANITVAKTYGYLGYQFIFRVHEAPNNDTLERIITNLKNTNCVNPEVIKNIQKQVNHAKKSGEKIKSKNIQILLNSIRNTPSFSVLSDLILKVMKRAHYSTSNYGHFGIAEDDYTHFTSPIRRASDLLVHTFIDKINDYYNGLIDEQELIDYVLKLDELCKHINEREREEDAAEKEVNDLKLAQYYYYHQDELPKEGTICDINRRSITIKVDKRFKIYVDPNQLGYQYMEQSNTYVSHKKVLSLGKYAYLDNIEVDLENKMILAHSISLKPIEKKHKKLTLKN